MDLLQNQASKHADIDPPDGMRGWARTRWLFRTECRYNSMTVFDIYVALLGVIWGASLLLRPHTFNGQPVLWQPLRTLFKSAAGSYWYDNGAQLMIGILLFTIHGLHLVAIRQRRHGDRLRRLTASAIVTGWSVLSLLFCVAAPELPAWTNLLVTVSFSYLALGATFRKAALR